MDDPKIIDDKLSYKLLIGVGGLVSLVVGIVHLQDYFNIPENQLNNLSIGLSFLVFGVVALIVFLDQRAILLSKNRIEIKSFFRKRVILKNDITGWGIEDYKTKHVSGERIRIFSKERSIKVFTSQYESIEDIKEFVQGKPELSADVAFRRERIEQNVILGIVVLMLGGLFWQMSQNQSIAAETTVETGVESDGELEALGIPVVLGKTYEIIEDDGDEITFKIYEYKNYIFKVNKANTPENIKDLKKELIVFIDEKENAQELSNYKESDSMNRNPKVMQADEILILEDLQPQEGKDGQPASIQITN